MPASSLVSNPTSKFGSFFFGSLARSSPSPTGLTFAAHPHVFARLVRVCFRDNLFRFILLLPTFLTSIIVDLRINETRQIGAVKNSAYKIWGQSVFLFFQFTIKTSETEFSGKNSVSLRTLHFTFYMNQISFSHFV